MNPLLTRGAGEEAEVVWACDDNSSYDAAVVWACDEKGGWAHQSSSVRDEGRRGESQWQTKVTLVRLCHRRYEGEEPGGYWRKRHEKVEIGGHECRPAWVGNDTPNQRLLRMIPYGVFPGFLDKVALLLKLLKASGLLIFYEGLQPPPHETTTNY